MPTQRFEIIGEASPALALRVLNLFAQQDLCFDRVVVERVADGFQMIVEARGLQLGTATIILEKMRAIILVQRAEMTHVV